MSAPHHWLIAIDPLPGDGHAQQFLKRCESQRVPEHTYSPEDAWEYPTEAEATAVRDYIRTMIREVDSRALIRVIPMYRAPVSEIR